MEQNSKIANNLVGEAIAQLLACTEIDTLGNWQSCDTNLPASQIAQLYSFPWNTPAPQSNSSPSNSFPSNSSQSISSEESPNLPPEKITEKITWAKGSQVLWLRQKLLIPTALQTYPLADLSLRLALTWWAASAQIFVDGVLVQQGDLFDAQARILLREKVLPGDTVEVMVRLVSPSHDQGALMRSRCIYELPYSTFENSPGLQLFDLHFIADQLAVYQQYLAEDQLQQLAEITDKIDWDLLGDREQFNLSLDRWYRAVSTLDLPRAIQNHKIHLLGHAHLDMAWLWEVAETWQVAQRTFESVIHLQEDFPELIFCHSTPALYQWIEQHRPDLFQIIHSKVQQGTWELVGGMWIEPEMNLISGESIARQLLYGQQYFLDKFGQTTQIAWLPDTFGFCASLPQFLKLAGINYFVTQKLDWNDTTKFPHPLFWWESADGSRVLSLMSNPIGEGFEPVKIATYGAAWQAKTGLDSHLWLMGVGDHGGGPSRDMLETIRRWQLNSQAPNSFPKEDIITSQNIAFPQLQFTTAIDYLEKINNLETSSKLPVWRDELYLEFHRGCYTTHGDQKYFNRYCEGLLYEVELLAAIATLTTNQNYPQAAITDIWKKVLFNQFHDILPGTSIAEVFATANQDWQAVIKIGKEIWEASWQTIFSKINLPILPQKDAQPIIVFNSLNWQRKGVVSLALPDRILDVSLDIQKADQTWQILDSNGQIIPSQLSISDPNTLLFLVENIPSIGFICFWLHAAPAIAPDLDVENPLLELGTVMEKDMGTEVETGLMEKVWLLENDYLEVLIDPITGDLARVFDLINEWEVLQETGGKQGNQLQFWQDQGQYWDAWNIDPNYKNHPLPSAELISISYLETGAIRQSIRVVRKFRNSTFIQDYILDRHSPLLKITTKVDWQESHVLVKVAFPITITTDTATYEIPYGTIDRPTEPTTEAEKAKWEVPALRWADLSDGEYGVSLLNDCKYGYEAQPDQLCLTLLRGSEWPDPQSDRTQHQFTYALYPHRGNYQQARTIHHGYELNLPLTTRLLPSSLGERNAAINNSPSSHSWISFQANNQTNEATENLVLSSLKQAEASPYQWILRCYETTGDRATPILNNSLGLTIAYKVNLLETELASDLTQPLETIESLEKLSTEPATNNLATNNTPNQDTQVEVSAYQIASFCLHSKM